MNYKIAYTSIATNLKREFKFDTYKEALEAKDNLLDTNQTNSINFYSLDITGNWYLLGVFFK